MSMPVSHRRLQKFAALAIVVSLLTSNASNALAEESKTMPEPSGVASTNTPPTAAPATPAMTETPLFNNDDFSSLTLGILTSNFLYRGISSSANQPAIQAVLEVSHKSGVYIGLFNSSFTNPISYTTSPYAGYDYKFTGGKIRAGVVWYNFPNYVTRNTHEYILQATYGRTRFDIGFLPKYPGSALATPNAASAADSNSTYFRASHSQMLTPKHFLTAAAGYSLFGDETKIGFKPYLDYKIGLMTVLGRNTLEISWNDTTRANLADAAFVDKTAVATLTMPF